MEFMLDWESRLLLPLLLRAGRPVALATPHRHSEYTCCSRASTVLPSDKHASKLCSFAQCLSRSHLRINVLNSPKMIFGSSYLNMYNFMSWIASLHSLTYLVSSLNGNSLLLVLILLAFW